MTAQLSEAFLFPGWMLQCIARPQKGGPHGVVAPEADRSCSYLIDHKEVLQRLSIFTGDITNLSDSSRQDLSYLLGNHP